jgi:hypothetical protein
MALALIEKPKSWWTVWRPKNLSRCLRIEWDDTSVTVRVLEKLDLDWNQDFRWADVTRVCFRDGGISHSDILFLELRGREKPATILTEA